MNKLSKGICLCVMLCAAALSAGCSSTSDAGQTEMAAQVLETGTAQTDGSASDAVVEETTTVTTTTASAAESVPGEETPLTVSEVLDMLGKSGLCEELDTVETLGGETFDGVCERLYGISPAELEDGSVMFVSSGTLADEVSVLAGKEGKGLTDLLRERGASRAKDFEGYSPEEHTKAEKAIVFEHKGLSVLVISDNADKIKKSILAM